MNKRKAKTGTVLWEAYVCCNGIKYRKWRICKITPKGIWITENYLTRKWVSYNTRFVSETKNEALENFYYKKVAHVHHCKRRLNHAEMHKRIAESAMNT